MKKILILILFVSILLPSCVTSKKYRKDIMKSYSIGFSDGIKATIMYFKNKDSVEITQLFQ